MEAPRTEAMKTGRRLCMSSEDMSMNIEPRPRTQIPAGSDLNVIFRREKIRVSSGAAQGDESVLERGLVIRGSLCVVCS